MQPMDLSLETLLFNAVETADSDARDAYLRQACGSDDAKLAELQSMVRDYFAAGAMFDRPAVGASTVAAETTTHLGRQIGPYKLRELLGEGGMGSVYVAVQEKPVRRKVALKIIKPGMGSREVISRFESERQALALMDHPNIAKVLDAGTTDTGLPYFVMELVKGVPITEHSDTQKLTTRDRLELFLQVCRAVQHAHQKGIIHRDIKPSNVIVAIHDVKPVVKVIDFGVAKAIGEQLTENTLYTAFSQLVGTPLYMSPEQAGQSSLDIDTRSDVYSLGVLLYELLTGNTPFDKDTLKHAGFDEMRRIIRDVEPPKPSARVSTLNAAAQSTVAEQRQLEPRKLQNSFRGELDWIVMKAIEKDRARRYQSASELADDIQRYLADTPVQACPPSSLYQLSKFVRRHRIAMSTTGLVAATLLTGFLISLWQADRAYKAMQRADSSLRNETQSLAKALKSELELQRQVYASETAEALNALNAGDRERARKLLDRAQPDERKADHREFGWGYANAIWNTLPKKLIGHTSGILTANLSPDNQWIVSGDREGTVKVWNMEAAAEVASWHYSNKEVTTAVFSPDGRTLATAGQDSTVRLWSTVNWQALACLRGHSGTICSLCWSPDSTRLASGSRDQSVRIWDVAAAKETMRIDARDVVRKVLWTSDGKSLVAADGKDIRCWDTEGWQPAGGHKEHAQGVLAIAISQDGSLLASGGYGGQVIVHNLQTEKLVARFNCGSSIWSLAFSPDGRHLAAGLADGGPMFWRINSSEQGLEAVRGGLELGTLVRSIEFTKDQSNLVVASEEDMTIRIWSSRSVLGYDYVSFPEDCLDVEVETDLAVNRRPDGRIVLRSFTRGDQLTELIGNSLPVREIAISKSGCLLATNSNTNEVLLWDLRSGSIKQRLTLFDNTVFDAPAIVQLSFSPDERWIAASGELSATVTRNSVRIWNTADGCLIKELNDVGQSPHLAFSPESDHVAVGAKGCFAIFPLINKDQPSVFDGATPRVWQIQYTPDGTQLVTSGDSQGAVVWDAATFQRRSQFALQRNSVESFSISPDGKTLATAGTDHTLRLWHFRSGQLLGTLLRHSCKLNWVKFASNSKLLLCTKLNDESQQGVFVFSAK